MPSFDFIPDSNVGETNKSSMIEINFGDGYSQRQNSGINSNKRIFQLTFNNRTALEGNSIKSFLRAREGVQSFDFTPPNEITPLKVICRMDDWSCTHHKAGLISVSARFEQVFE